MATGANRSVAATGAGLRYPKRFWLRTAPEFDVLVHELDKSVAHYWHNNKDVNLPWWRAGSRVKSEDPIPISGNTDRICQLTGLHDDERNAPAFNAEACAQAGVKGTDLGSSFEHGGRVFFLFGDTDVDNNRRHNLINPDRDDTVAWTDQPNNADAGIRLTFNPGPPIVPDISQGGFEVPTEGFSLPPFIYVYFTTDHITDGEGNDSMGRTVLARSSDGANTFSPSLYTLSTDKFINVSIHIERKTTVPGISAEAHDALFIWGSGRYRRDNVYMAYMPLAHVEDRSRLRYLSTAVPVFGNPNILTPSWSESEADAMPLFLAGFVGELSVRWNPLLRRFLMLYGSDNFWGIHLRMALQPWGPWSAPKNLANPDRFKGFVHPDGGTYGFYQIPRYALRNRNPEQPDLFAMSTWRPYEAMLMTADVRADDNDPRSRSHSGNFIQSSFGRQGTSSWWSRLAAALPLFPGQRYRGFPWHGPFVFFDSTLSSASGGTAGIPVSPTGVSLLQSNFGEPGNLELIARLSPTIGEDRLVSFFRDGTGWHGPFDMLADGNPIIGLTGNPAFIQSSFGRKGNFELVVPLGGRLAHYFRDNDIAGFPWHGPFVFFDSTLSSASGGTAGIPVSPTAVSLLQSNFGEPGNLELIARLSPTIGEDRLVSFFRDGTGWHGPSDMLADGNPIIGLTGNPAFIQSSFGRQGNFELVVPLGGRLAHYFRDNDVTGFPWHGPFVFFDSTLSSASGGNGGHPRQSYGRLPAPEQFWGARQSRADRSPVADDWRGPAGLVLSGWNRLARALRHACRRQSDYRPHRLLMGLNLRGLGRETVNGHNLSIRLDAEIPDHNVSSKAQKRCGREVSYPGLAEWCGNAPGPGWSRAAKSMSMTLSTLCCVTSSWAWIKSKSR